MRTRRDRQNCRRSDRIRKQCFSGNWDELGKKQAEKLEIPVKYIDKKYGVVLIDSEDNLYCILVDKAALPDQEDGSTFSNPKIEPFNLEEEW